jgi:hypothetical protein
VLAPQLSLCFHCLKNVTEYGPTKPGNGALRWHRAADSGGLGNDAPWGQIPGNRALFILKLGGPPPKAKKMISKGQGLDELVADLLREGSPISTHLEPRLATALEPTSREEPKPTVAVVEPSRGNGIAIPEQANSVLAGLNLDTAIRLRWALRDIKAKRTKLSPVSPNDLAALLELGFVEMRDGVPVLTSQGDRALD